MPAGSNKERERQCEHIKEQAEESGTSHKWAKETRRPHGEQRTCSLRRSPNFQQTSTHDPKLPPSAARDVRRAPFA
ncbi:hypothetical protein Stsp01_65820 [Streptomyces sp. NBRC 13847]|nr:hypothetical protein Stsp01_65820 [Streptomyces sp. NBRC 13847]